jgi:hypothetical protein
MIVTHALALLALMTTSAGAVETDFVRVRNYGQQYMGFQYRVNNATGQGSVLMSFRELVDMPGNCGPNPDCPPQWRYRYLSARAEVPNLSYDAAANRIVYTNPQTNQATVCATTEVRQGRRGTTLYIYPTGDCSLTATRDRSWFYFSFGAK